MSALLIALSLAAAPSPPEEASWCEAVLNNLAQIDVATEDPTAQQLAKAQLRALTDTLPDALEPVSASALRHLADDGDAADGAAVLASAAADACRPEALSGEQARAEVQAVIDEGGFERTRQGADLIDVYLERLQSWLFELLESEGMQRYAEGSRFVYLTFLVLAGLWIAGRLVLAHRRRRTDANTPADDEEVVRERLRGARSLLDEARAALVEHPRRAVLLAFLALLARVGEHVPGAVAPAKTGREVLRDLPDVWRERCRPLVARYERAIYADTLAKAEAPAFVEAIAAVVELS